ncbi:MAG: galactokinase family protein [Clostridiales bacterium]|nr:galactokinase family protein [Clostridiales bacterium]
MNKEELKNKVKYIDIEYLYGCSGDERGKYEERFKEVIDGFEETFGNADGLRLFSAPGRTEIGGNHTDHQHGAVLAGSLNLDVIGAAKLNGSKEIRIKSKGFIMDVIDIDELAVNEEEYGRAGALIKGVAAKFKEKGYKIEGFDAYTVSSVLKGSGMSSSAAFEVLIGTMMNCMFANSEINPVEIAKIGQFAENVYFGKPCGLLDQTACSVGNMVAIDFASTEKPVVEKVDFDFASTNHALCIIDTGADHSDLTDEYAAIPAEMKRVAQFFGKDFLNDVKKDEFTANIKEVRKAIGDDRAVLRALHYFNETERAKMEASALKKGDFEEFLRLVRKSGLSSYMYLQNVYAASAPHEQAVSLALALCDELLGDRGAYRVHGGGFAGTIQAFVPCDMLDEFKKGIEAVLGEGMCHVLSIRPVGGCELKIK